MSTIAQVTANRANAQFSTGPKTPESLEKTKYNALKHGLTGAQVVIKGEDPAEYDRQRAELFASYAPVGAVEEMFTEQIVQCWWRLQRAERLEPAITKELGEIAIYTDDKAAKKHSLFMRHRTSIDRSWRHAIRELEKLQTARTKRQAAQFQAEMARAEFAARQQAQSKAPASEIGFVLQSAPKTPELEVAAPADTALKG